MVTLMNDSAQVAGLDLFDEDIDVIVVGAGNAGLIAAISAREAGARVLLVEGSRREDRGGNSRFASGVFRVAHAGSDDLRSLVSDAAAWPWDCLEVESYPADRFKGDLVNLGAGFVNEDLVAMIVDRSMETVRWMKDHGVEWGLSLTKLAESIREGEKVRLPAGGELTASGRGVGLVESLFAAAEQIGVGIVYGLAGCDLVTSGRRVTGIFLRDDEHEYAVSAAAVVLASGGFEASAEARLRYLGPGWDLVKVRGTALNTGAMLDRAIALGASAAGHWSGAHAVPIAADAPSVGDPALGDVTARYSYPYGVTVNIEGKRFLDEAEDLMPFTYTEIGRKILGQPRATAFQVFDARGAELLEPRYEWGRVTEADSITALAEKTSIPVSALQTTIRDFNEACHHDQSRFDPQVTDGLAARPAGQPPKSNWATPLDCPPFRAYQVTCGITFTFGGVAVDESSRVLGVDRRPIPGLLAAGEIAGGFFAFNVPSGSGLIRGAVCARIAGRTAAREMQTTVL
jgi:tricarballylate dehydrogenase